MCGRLDAYLLSFSHLQTSKDKNQWSVESNYRSPAKPLLLLAVLNYISSGRIVRNFISPNRELSRTYHRYFTLLSPDIQPTNMAIPFQRLAKSTFWELRQRSGKTDYKNCKISTLDQLQKMYFGAKFSDDLYILLQMEHSRDKLRNSLIESHFSANFQTVFKHLGKTK